MVRNHAAVLHYRLGNEEAHGIGAALQQPLGRETRPCLVGLMTARSH